MKAGPVKLKKAPKSSLYDQDSVIYAKSHLMFTNYNLACQNFKSSSLVDATCLYFILFFFFFEATEVVKKKKLVPII